MNPTLQKIVVVVVGLTLVLGGLGAALAGLRSGDDDSRDSGGRRAPVAVTPAPGSQVPADPALEEFYTQTIDWAECDDFWCATLTVPLDYSEPTGKTIGIALLTAPAVDEDSRIGSLVVNPGGPGAPGTEYAAQADLAFRAPVTERYDIVGFDPRGTGRSAPVDCLPDDELDTYLASDPVPETPQEVTELVERTEAFTSGCAERSGDIASHVSTIESARDLDVLRAALGESTLAYFGASYGTQLGATYAELFPTKVGRLVLDGGVDVSLDSRGQSLGQAKGFETALRAYVADCVEGGDCVLGDSLDAGLTRISDLLDTIAADPLPTKDGRELAVGNAFYGIVTPLYVEDYWPALTIGLEQALDGDGTMLMSLADAYASRDGSGYLNNSTEAIVAIRCLDDPASVPADQVPEQYAAFDEVSPTFGRVFAWGLVGCAGFPLRSAEPPLEIVGEGAAPILVVGTTRDPATPYEWSQALADQLDSGVLLTRDGDGHTGYNAGNACVDTTVEGYLISGTVPSAGQRC